MMVSRQNLKKGGGILQNQAAETPETKKPKKRHGCLLVYLSFLIVSNFAVSLMYLFPSSVFKAALNLPEWLIIVLVIFGILEVICEIALLMWKKWAFWAICALSVIMLC